MKRSNRYIVEVRGNELLKASDVRFSRIYRRPEEVTEPDGHVTPLPGARFDLCNVDVTVLEESDTYEFFQWLQSQNPENDLLAVYLIDRFGVIKQSYEMEDVIPVGLTPEAMGRLRKNEFHADSLHFIGNVRRISPS